MRSLACALFVVCLGFSGIAAAMSGGAGGSAAKALNPDISVIGDFIGALVQFTKQPRILHCDHSLCGKIFEQRALVSG